MQPKQKKTKSVQKRKQVISDPAKETEIVKLENELKEVQQASRSIVKPEISVISDPELYFSFMEIAALNLFATRKSPEALKIMTQLFTQYQEYKSKIADEYDVLELFSDSHTEKKEEENK